MTGSSVPLTGGGSAAPGPPAAPAAPAGSSAMIPRAAWRIACEAGESGSAVTSGVAVVGVLAQRLGERHLAEQRHVELVGEQLAAALAEDREALAVGGREAGHVLDHAEHLEVDLRRPSRRRGGRPTGRPAAAW